MFLRTGDSGENIKTIQEMLIKLGYKPGAIDGLFGKKTEKAVADFQESVDLHVGSGMENRGRDPYIVAPDGVRYWRVYVRAEAGEQMEINAVTYGSRNRGRIVSGKFLI